MSNRTYLIIEFFLLFVLLPVSLATPINTWFKVSAVCIGFVYLLFILFKRTAVNFKIKKGIQWASFFKNTFIKLFVIAIATTAFVWVMEPQALFCVPINKPKLFIFILFIYTFLSVWPQEIIYRTFFFERYEELFDNTKLFIFLNAIVFSLAHIFFKNTLVLVLTFIGGLLFAYTFVKTKSTTLVSIEHALYGNWLFTVGMGEMLAFPGQEACL